MARGYNITLIPPVSREPEFFIITLGLIKREKKCELSSRAVREAVFFIIKHEVYQEGKEVGALFLESIFFIIKHEVYQEGKEVRAQFLETLFFIIKHEVYQEGKEV